MGELCRESHPKGNGAGGCHGCHQKRGHSSPPCKGFSLGIKPTKIENLSYQVEFTDHLQKLKKAIARSADSKLNVKWVENDDEGDDYEDGKLA